MRVLVPIGEVLYEIDTEAAVELSLPLVAGGHGVRLFGAGAPVAEAYRVGDFVGDTRQGGSVNVETWTLTPHCHGTHTESIGHIVDERVSIAHVLRECLLPATVLTVEPTYAQTTSETLPEPVKPTDRVITSTLLAAALARASGVEGFEAALVVRTLPNDEAKRAADYDTSDAAYFSFEAMQWVVARGARHLVVDLPSVDRMNDGGVLMGHRCFWGLPLHSRRLADARRPLATITELVWVPPTVHDGPAILQIQIPPLVSDAAPSRVFHYGCRPAAIARPPRA